MCLTPLGTRSGTMKPSTTRAGWHSVFSRRGRWPFGQADSWPAAGRRSRGVTLIELMVALAITMIMMTAVITLFANVTATVSNSRALIEISERLRTARNRLQLDLAGHTATTIPPLRPEDGEGYLEIIEGPNTDAGSYAAASQSCR